MSKQYQSPYLVVRDEYFFDSDSRLCQLSDEVEQQRKVRLRAARIRPESRSGLVWGFAINCVLWALLIMGGRWIWMLLR